jgi:hypothetical protein
MSDKETMEQKLLRLVAENPGVPILPCVDYDVCCDDTFSWWIGRISEVEVRTRIYYDPSGKAEYEHVYFDDTDGEEIREMIENTLIDKFEDDKLLDAAIERVFSGLKQETVIALKIGV